MELQDAHSSVELARRRREREHLVARLFAVADVQRALDLLELLDFAWHDCHGEATPPPEVIADVLLLSNGSPGGLIGAAHLALFDRHDLKLAAAARAEPQ
jgi:hypothetical protein